MRFAFQVYTSDSVGAVEAYCDAFGASLGYNVIDENGDYFHAELMLPEHGCFLAVSSGDGAPCRTMQFSVNFGKENDAALKHAYEVLSRGGTVHYELGPCDWNEKMADVTDRFGVRWYIAY